MSYLSLIHIENNTIQFRLYYTNRNRKKLVIETTKEDIVEKYKNKKMRDLSQIKRIFLWLLYRRW